MSRAGKGEVEPIPIGAGRGPRYWGRFYALLSIAAIVATIGLNANSGAVVIAAMLLAPLMEPILGIASTLVQGYLLRVLRLLVATAIAAVVTIAWGYVILRIFDVPTGVDPPVEVMSRTTPGLPDLVVALVAGTAGAYVQLRREEAGLVPGVAIGVSLVPPLAASGILIYQGQPELAQEAALLFLTNLAAIVLSACVVFFALGMRPARPDRAATLRVGLGAVLSVVVVLVIAGHLAERTVRHLKEAHEEQRIVGAIRTWARDHPVDIRHVEVESDEVWIRLLFGVPLESADELVAPGDLVSADLDTDKLGVEITRILGRDVVIHFSGQVLYESDREVKYTPPD